jgi:hypothetical protein
MKNIHNSNKWFSIVLAMWITIVLSLIAILILEFIIPFSRNVKSVENWSSAYYYAYAGVEESLWELAKQTEDGYDYSTSFSTWATGSQYDLASMTTIIPPAWDGNSEYDEDWNRFDSHTPIQLALTDDSWSKINVNFNSVNFYFRIPETSSWVTKTLSGSQDIIINWIVSWLDSTSQPVVLNASGSTNNINYVRVNDINTMTTTPWTPWVLWWRDGLTLDWQSCEVQEFFSNSAPCAWVWTNTRPILKMSIVNKLEDTDGGIIPYLEYRIDFAWTSVPWRYSQINTAGKSNGYKKTMDIKVPQTSTNQAFDFAVFQ